MYKVVRWVYFEEYTFCQSQWKALNSSFSGTFEEHLGCPVWETFNFPILRDTQFSVFEGHAGHPSWGTSKSSFCGTFGFPFLGDTYVLFFEGLGTNQFPYFRDKLVSLFERQIGSPLWGTDQFSFWRDTSLSFLGAISFPIWGTNWLLLLRDKSVSFFERQISFT